MCLEPIIALLQYPVVSKFQLFSCRFKLKTLEAVLLIHQSFHFVQCTSIRARCYLYHVGELLECSLKETKIEVFGFFLFWPNTSIFVSSEKNTSPESIWFVRVESSKFQLSLKVYILKQGLLSYLALVGCYWVVSQQSPSHLRVTVWVFF